MKNLSYWFQALFLKLFLFIFSVLPPQKASQLGGAMMLLLSPLLGKQNKHALKNLNLIYPHKSTAEKVIIIKGMWRNIGMNLGEYPHLLKAYHGHTDFKIDVLGKEHLSDYSKPTLYISAHIGNWEALPLIVAKLKRPFYSLYRPPNNPFIRDTLNKLRTLDGILPNAYTKGNKGFVALARHLKSSEDIGILLDQRHSGGEHISFFGHAVEASFAPIDLAIKYNARIIMGRVIRKGPCDFIVEAFPAIQIDGRTRTQIMGDVYKNYETWINEHPEQWLWMHRRWGKDL